jgi:hypothetical protein
MRIAVQYAACLLAFLPLLQGCDQKSKAAQTQPLAPPIVDAPPPKPATVSTADLPPPVVGNTQPTQPPQDTAAAKPAEPPKKPVHHRKSTPSTGSNTTAATDTAKATPPAQAAGQPSESAIGQLSGGASGDLRSQTEETINSVEKGVNAITRTLNDSEVKTVAQIREFLKEAREALATGDTDGAHTLANKAKVLLGELNPQ